MFWIYNFFDGYYDFKDFKRTKIIFMKNCLLSFWTSIVKNSTTKKTSKKKLVVYINLERDQCSWLCIQLKLFIYYCYRKYYCYYLCEIHIVKLDLRTLQIFST